MSDSFMDVEPQVEILIEDLLDCTGKPEVKKFFQEDINVLIHQAQTHGLSNENIAKIVDFLITTSLFDTNYKKVIKCLIPEKNVPSEIVEKLIIWLISFQNYKLNQNKAKYILEWINALLDYHLTDRRNLDSYYIMFMAMIKYRKLGPITSKLIYLLTKCRDVNLIHINQIRNLCKIEPIPCYKQILRKYKEFRPDLIPEDIPHHKLTKCFPQIPKDIRECFEKAEKRLDPLIDIIDFNDAKLIPCYLSKPSTSNNRKTKSLAEIDNIKQLMENLHDIKEPCSALSCLLNDSGFLYLLFSSDEFKYQFSYSIYQVLYNTFINKEGERIPLNKKKMLLNQIFKFQTLLPFGIYSLSLFLKDFLKIWDFDGLELEILKLIPFVTFSDYKDLNDSYLYHIQRLFFVSDINIKNEILISLTTLSEKLIIYSVKKNDDNFKSFYKTFKHFDWSFETTFFNLMKFISYICEKGLHSENGDYTILHHSLQFYEKINILERKFDLPTLTLPPPGVTYRCIFSNDEFFLSRISGLLNNYISRILIFENIEEEEISDKMMRNLNIINMYINDYFAFIFEGRPFNNEKSYFIKTNLENLCTDYDHPFDITKHGAFLPSILTILRKNKDQLIKRDEIINEMDPEIKRLFKNLQERKNNI